MSRSLEVGGAMPVMRQGEWWEQRPDGVWLKWDAGASRWVEHDGDPPEPSPSDPIHAHPTDPLAIEPYRSLKRVATVLLVLLGIGLGLDLFAVWSDSAEISLLQKIQDGGFVTRSEADTSDTRQAAIGFTQLGLFTVQIVVFLVWFRRAYRNLPALGARNLRYKPGWAVGAWFVPFLNWFRPVQIANDIWKASDPTLPEAPDTPWQTRSSTALIGFWWAAWWIADRVGQQSFRSSLDAETIGEYLSSARITMAADITSAIATLFLIAVAWAITKREETRAQKLRTAGTLG